MTGADAKRFLGVGQGTLAQKALTHRDPFEPEQSKPAAAEVSADAWAEAVKQFQRAAGHP